jgi:hypothetical protein
MTRGRKLAGAARGSASAGSERRSRLELAALGNEGDSRAVAFVALKYYRPEHQCLSEWTADELRGFSAFCRKLSQMTWQQIIESGGRQKTGVGWTRIDPARLPNTDFLDSISEDISWIELRVTQEARVFGFRAGQAFFLVFLDRTHDIFPD